MSPLHAHEVKAMLLLSQGNFGLVLVELPYLPFFAPQGTGATVSCAQPAWKVPCLGECFTVIKKLCVTFNNFIK